MAWVVVTIVPDTVLTIPPATILAALVNMGVQPDLISTKTRSVSQVCVLMTHNYFSTSYVYDTQLK